jgi:DNA ligase D-like protein (predicted 3'-phosphoesterase)
MTGLKKYKETHKFNKSFRPEGAVSDSIQRRFVVHKHQARHLHYDFRLEIDGVLKSWAVPKGVPLESGVKRLAVQVEDHPVEYIDFSGKIPEGQYGAGIVEIWDSGNYELAKQHPDRLEFILCGDKISGIYVLIHTDKNNWLLMRRMINQEI